MSYRPQFSFEPAPPGFRDEDFVYVFDKDNTPVIANGLLPGQSFLNVQLPLETGGEYRVRSIEVVDRSGILGVRFRDAFGTLLSPPSGFLGSGVFVPSSQPGASVALESELVCPGGSNLSVDLVNTI